MSPTESPTQSAKIFSTEEFHSAVHAIAPRVAVFDCDGTLWSGDAGSGFMRWTIAEGLLSAEAISWLDQRYKAYLSGQVSEVTICGEMVQVYRGLRESDMRAAAATFFSTQIERNIFPEMLALVQELQSSGTEIWAVSSTCDWVIEEGVKRFNIPANRVLAAHVAIDNSLVTSHILDVPTDQGKVAALARFGITAPDVVFGNSIHDSNMLAIARGCSTAIGAFPVNPSPALLEGSARESWPVYYPASVTPSATTSQASVLLMGTASAVP